MNTQNTTHGRNSIKSVKLSTLEFTKPNPNNKMENNIRTMAKKLWSIVRVIYFMVRNGICKRKLLLDLNLMKRGKIAGKAFGNLMFQGSHHHHKDHADHRHYSAAGAISSHGKEYEFSCSNTPFHVHFTKPMFHLSKRCKRNNNKNYKKNSGTMTNAHYIEDVDDLEGVSRALEMMLNSNGGNLKDNIGSKSSSSGSFMSFEPSPTLYYNLPGLGFGKSPMVRPLRITDSPFPVQNMDDDTHVDEAADAFIQRFYNQLKRQKSIGGDSTI